jgi:hypothetical protein
MSGNLSQSNSKLNFALVEPPLPDTVEHLQDCFFQRLNDPSSTGGVKQQLLPGLRAASPVNNRGRK